MPRSIVLLLLAFPALACADASRPGAAEQAGDSNDEGWHFKLTPSYYATSNQHSAADINLRANNGPHALWLGYYQRGAEFEQARTGYELTIEGDYAKLIPSLQLATHGFAGMAVNLELGSSVFALLGYGRTNTKDYYNLNFDPNDAFTIGIGTRLIPRTNLALYAVKDNRLHTEQVISHLVARVQLQDRQRLTFDIFKKSGRESPEDPKVSGSGLAVTYDYHDVFIRAARDRKVNYSMDDQTRVSVGFRF